MNFLLVDDSRTVRVVLKNAITNYFNTKRWGVPVIFEAHDGLEAMEYMKEQKIDIMFLDYNMPNMNGEEVIDAIRMHKKWNKTRIVMATTEGSKATVQKILKKGVNGYLVKPFMAEAINKTLGILIQRMIKCSA